MKYFEVMRLMVHCMFLPMIFLGDKEGDRDGKHVRFDESQVPSQEVIERGMFILLIYSLQNFM